MIPNAFAAVHTDPDNRFSIEYPSGWIKEVADAEFFEGQKEILQTWHNQDPADANEIFRTWQIAEYQENKPNPFILDATLIERAYFYVGLLQGDMNEDGELNILDVVILTGIILN